MKKISHNKPYLDNLEIKAIANVLKRNWLIPDLEVKKFENSIKRFVGEKYAVATNSGSSARHLALVALGIDRGDEVIIPTYTCTALLNTIYYQDAIPVIVDVEKDGFNIDPAKVKTKINKKTKAIIVPHILGFPAKIDEIKKYNIPVIEDCAHAIGSFYKGKPLGSYGDINIFSFYATKVITTGHGGMVTTNNKNYSDVVADLIHYDQRLEYKLRYNYQMTEVAAAIGNAQFAKFDFLMTRRKYIAKKYVAVLDKYKSVEYFPKKNASDLNHYRFIIKFKNSKIRNKFKKGLEKEGISTIIPIETYQLLHRYLKLDTKKFPNAENLAKTALVLPVHPGLTEEEITKVATRVDHLCAKL